MFGMSSPFLYQHLLLVLVVGLSSFQGPHSRAIADAASLKETAASIFRPHDHTTKEESCACGVQVQPTKIVGGSQTKPSEFPWMVVLLYNSQLRCGGALINDRFVVTAAHCTMRLKARFLTVNLGAHDLSKSFEPHRRNMKVFRVIEHPDYRPTTHQNDIALLELYWPVRFTPTILPVCLPYTIADYNGKIATVAGWGRNTEGGSTQTILRKVDVPVVSMKTCQDGYSSFRIDTEKMICAGTDKGGKDSCQGDSGGPLVLKESGHYTLIGVVSFGEGCGRPAKPGVYARVDNYIDFILNNTADALYCPAYNTVPPAKTL